MPTQSREWRGRLRCRGPARTDSMLMVIHDALPPDVLLLIYGLHLTRPPPYSLRSNSRVSIKAKARPAEQ